MLQQVVGSVFTLMEEYEPVWRKVRSSEPADLFGFRYDVGLDPVTVNLGRMLSAFQRGCHDLSEIWAMAVDPDTLAEIVGLAAKSVEHPEQFHLDDELWSRILIEFACAHHRRPIRRSTCCAR
jgi:hypothetical protein